MIYYAKLMPDFLDYIFIVLAWIMLMCTILVIFFVISKRKRESKERMNKEKQIQDDKAKQLLDELSKMPPMVVATAYLHAISYTMYGTDVTEKWITATQNSAALEKAYKKGYYDGLQRQTDINGNNNQIEQFDKKEITVLDKVRAEIESYNSEAFYPDDVLMRKRIVLDIIDKYIKESEDKRWE